MVNACTESIQEEIDLSLVDRVIEEHGAGAGSLIPVLQKTQEVYGYLPSVVMDRISQGLLVPASTVYGVVTFFAQFRLKPVGKYIVRVCHGTACHVAGADKITEAFARELGVPDGETSPDRLFTLESVACVGCCSLAPVAMVGNETFGRLDGRGVVKVIKNYRRLDAGRPAEVIPGAEGESHADD
jgi:NADH-quinone oxidoreductase subunit E